MERGRKTDLKKKKIITISIGCILCMTISACSLKKNVAKIIDKKQATSESDRMSDITWDIKKVHIPGLTKQYELIIVNDQHIIVPDDDYILEKNDEINQRVMLFSDSNGKTSSETWAEIVDTINAEKPDGVILNGDMVDFFSEANLNCLMDGVKQIEAPVMYNRADHDLGIWYSDTYTDEDVQQREKKAWEMEDVMVQDFDEFLVVGINNNTSQLTEVGLQKVKEIWSEGKPIILTLHVPLKSTVDNGLSDASKEVWQDRALLWGTDCFYSPDDVTQQFLDMVFAEDSPVVAVVGAHLHFAYEDQLTEWIPQFVFDASYKGTIGVLTIE